MVLWKRGFTMSLEQPVKKKPKREENNRSVDETDFIQNLSENVVPSNLQSLHLSLPPDVNEDDISLNGVNLGYSTKSFLEADTSELEKSASEFENSESDCALTETNTLSLSRTDNESSVAPESNHSGTVNIHPISTIVQTAADIACSDVVQVIADNSLNNFQQHLIKQCLCGISETILHTHLIANVQHTSTSPNDVIVLNEWSDQQTIQFLSNLQLLFDIYLKQNNNGFICTKIVLNCEMILYNQCNLIEQIISLCESRNTFILYLAAKVLSSFIITAKANINNDWIELILRNLTSEVFVYSKTNFCLEIIKRVVEWKDVDIHILEDTDLQGSSGSSNPNSNCVRVPFRDAESFDTSSIKGLIIKSLESIWPDLIRRIENSIVINPSPVDSETCTLTFLMLWERIISVKANLSVIDIKPFYAHLETFVALLNNNLPSIIWKQLLSLFNEVLCYGSTLSLQDMVPDDTCQLAHLIVRYVKDYRLLDSLPFRQEPGNTINTFIGSILSSEPAETAVDRTLLQKMVLLVLKSVAVTIKETRSDSSDSSVGSEDYDFYQDMQMIERSIRDVLKKVDAFVKNSLEFHPETPFCKIMIHLFCDQDNYLIESMVCTLDIAVGISYRNAVFPDLTTLLNPVHSFTEFLKIVSHDSDVLLDYLVGSETCFLLYLLRFLKYTRRNWPKFVSSCAEGNTPRSNELDDTMTVLIRLKMQINRLVSRELFPYNINPILRLLTVCEGLYDGNEYS
ncbi:protein lines [Dendroctonus ponderosae]|uniref:Protein lines n=1 Tax=Dendroctonus ponderosae TaxID=77166 RepID=A0AAR5P9U4_DENPD|nr:protein lines [Dendroctonus ponderosae]XP_019757853.1 protein lines [Dendroctonus ponderosae]